MNNQEHSSTMTPTMEHEPGVRPPEPALARGATTGAHRDFFDDPRRKSPVLALVLSLMPGLGQVYVGFYQQGFTNALIVASLIALLNSGRMSRLEPLFGLFLAFYWLYNVVDAWRRAVFYNNALAGIGPATLPEDFSMSERRGSLGGGVALILVGVVMLSNTLFNVPLDWLEQWWPVAFILVGAWLLYPNLVGRSSNRPPAA